MKHTFSKTQKKKIKDAQQKAAALKREMDVLFDELVRELDFDKYQEAFDSSCELLGEYSNNPIGLLFDTIYNTEDEDIDEIIKKLEIRVLAYHLE